MTPPTPASLMEEAEQPFSKEEEVFYNFLLKEGWLEKDREYLDGYPITEEYTFVNTPSLEEVPDCVRALKGLCDSYAAAIQAQTIREMVKRVEGRRAVKIWPTSTDEKILGFYNSAIDDVLDVLFAYAKDKGIEIV